MADVILVASGGGHLEQLRYLSDRLPFDGKRRWITFDTPQSNSLLEGEDVTFVPYMGPRDYAGLLQNLRRSVAVGSKRSTEAVVSTGAGLALAYLPVSAARGIPTHYIESATRVLGPSFTGRVLARTPGVEVYTQHQSWANEKWRFNGSVFESFQAVDGASANARHGIRKVVVSLGTIRPFGFRRLVERLVDLFDREVEVVWQTGATDVAGLPIDARPEIPHSELFREIRSSDLLVAHAGTGIALTAFRAGTCPILVPREAAHGEHVDDHQAQIGKLLGDAGLAVTRTVESLLVEDLALAASKTIIPEATNGAGPLLLK